MSAMFNITLMWPHRPVLARGAVSTWVVGRTEELLGSTTLLNDLHETGLELLNRGNVVGENTHLSGLGGNVDLDTKWKRS